MRSSIGYRADIDGLRAIAVVPVVLYHAGVPFLSGGYNGVDIFFVISGFLITSIIAKEIEAGSFSLVGFYERRARRILPALFSVLLASLVAGWLLTTPSEFHELSESVIATIFFSSNFYFWETTDYFATASEYRPLLHTWSLAVEEQFYIVVPLLIMALAKRSKSLLSMTLLLFFASLLLSTVGTRASPETSFYLAPARAWELLAGVLLALNVIPAWSNRVLRETAASVGLVLIGFAVITFDATTVFPGSAALIPCTGAALVIQAGRGAGPPTLASRFLSLNALVFVGLISYSLYLWHWPVLAFSRIVLKTAALPATWSLGAIAGAFVLAALSWRFVELPFRARGVVSRARIFRYSGVGASALAVFSIAVMLTDGFAVRFSDGANQVLAGAQDIEPDRRRCMGPRRGDAYCVTGAATAEPTYVFWGDSHAAALMSAVGVALEARQQSGYLLSNSACPPLLDVVVVNGVQARPCNEVNAAMMDFIGRNVDQVDTVILAARWAFYVTGERAPGEAGTPLRLAAADGTGEYSNRELVDSSLAKTIQALNALGLDVLVLGGVPEIGWNVPHTVALSIKNRSTPPLAPTLEDTLERNAVANEILARVALANQARLIPLAPLLCTPDCIVMDGLKPVYIDDNHLSLHGARTILGPKLASEFASIPGLRRASLWLRADRFAKRIRTATLPEG